MLQPPLTPLIIELVEPVTEEISVADVLVGALSLAGWVILGAVLLALVFAGTLIVLRRHSRSDPLSGDDSSATRLNLHLPSR